MGMKKLFLIFILLLGICVPPPAYAQQTGRHRMRLSNLATKVKAWFKRSNEFQNPIFIQNDNLPNAYQISPTLYRGGQPNEEGYRWLAARGENGNQLTHDTAGRSVVAKIRIKEREYPYQSVFIYG